MTADGVVSIVTPPSHQIWQQCQWSLNGSEEMTSVTVTVSLLWCMQCQQCRPALSHRVLQPAVHVQGSTAHTGQEEQSHQFHWSRNHTGNLHRQTDKQVTCTNRQTDRQIDVQTDSRQVTYTDRKKKKAHSWPVCGGVVEGAQIIHKGAS